MQLRRRELSDTIQGVAVDIQKTSRCIGPGGRAIVERIPYIFLAITSNIPSQIRGLLLGLESLGKQIQARLILTQNKLYGGA